MSKTNKNKPNHVPAIPMFGDNFQLVSFTGKAPPKRKPRAVLKRAG